MWVTNNNLRLLTNTVIYRKQYQIRIWSVHTIEQNRKSLWYNPTVSLLMIIRVTAISLVICDHHSLSATHIGTVYSCIDNADVTTVCKGNRLTSLCVKACAGLSITYALWIWRFGFLKKRIRLSVRRICAEHIQWRTIEQSDADVGSLQ